MNNDDVRVAQSGSNPEKTNNNSISEHALLCLVAAIIVEIINMETYGRSDRLY